MKLSEYLLDRIFSLICMLVAALVLLALLWLIETPTVFILFAEVILLAAYSTALLYDFFRKQSFYNLLQKMTEQLDIKTLLGELLVPPHFLEGQILVDVLRCCNKYQNDQLACAEQENREYREYLDSWVHEIKTPITSARLIVENEKNPTTLRIDDELRKIDAYVEQVLYYARSTDVEKDFKVEKTTLQALVYAALKTYSKPLIQVGGKPVLKELDRAQLADFRGKKLGFIFQNFNLLDTLTAYENISLALSIVGAKPSEIEQRIPQIAQALNIQDVLDKYPYQMSGGQQQRVAAARAMVTNPAIVLADEPTGALDSNSSRMLLTMLTELNERLSATILMVTHDAFSASYCNRILFIKDGQVFNELHRGTDVAQKNKK